MSEFSNDVNSAPFAVVAWQQAVLQNPRLYLGATPTGQSIARAIDRSARILGSGRTALSQAGSWWIYSAETDWLFNSAVPFDRTLDVFDGFNPFPEPGEANWFRTECLCLPFSEQVYTATACRTDVLKGRPASSEAQQAHRSAAIFAGRSIVYRLKDSG